MFFTDDQVIVAYSEDSLNYDFINYSEYSLTINYIYLIEKNKYNGLKEVKI